MFNVFSSFPSSLCSNSPHIIPKSSATADLKGSPEDADEGISLSSAVAAKDSSAASVLPKGASPTPMETSAEDVSISPPLTKSAGTSPLLAPKGVSSKGTSPASKRPFLCSCGRSFETRRGLSIHLSHEPKHFNTADKATLDAGGKEELANVQDSRSAPSSPTPRETTPKSPCSSTPSSPNLYSMSSLKPSARNPQYYSIIRTRRGSNVNDASGGNGQETGVKRSRPVGPPGTSSPAKAMHLNTGEKVPVQQDDDASVGDVAPASTESVGGRKKSGESKGKDATTPRGQCGDTISSPSDDTALSKSILGSSVMQEFNLRSSPMTRSKKKNEFVSLPSRRKRGKRGAWRGGATTRADAASSKLNLSSEDNASEVGEDFEVSGDLKCEEERGDEKSCSQDSNKGASDTEKSQPPKRKRGRPPKVRKDTPTGSPVASSAGVMTKSNSSPSLSITPSSHASPGPISSSTRSNKSHVRGAVKAEKVSVKAETADESPLPAKTEKGLGSRDKAKVSHDKRVESRDESVAESEASAAPPPAASKCSRKSEKGSVAPPPSPASDVGKTEVQDGRKHFTSTRSHSKQSAEGEGETSTSSGGGNKKAGNKASKASGKDTSEADSQPSGSTKSKGSASDPVGSKPGNSTTNTSSPAKEPRNKSKKSTPKSRTPSKSDKTEHKKSVSETEEAVRDEIADAVVKTEMPEPKNAEEPAPPTAQIPLSQQRQSVLVSVLSGQEKEPTAEEQTDAASTPPESANKESGASEPSLQHKDSQRRVSETSPVYPYPSSSTPTPTYSPFSPYHPSFPPHPHMMYPPSAPPSTMYPFYGYPGSMPMPHPSHGAYYPHMAAPTVPLVAPPITTGDQNMLAQTPYSQSFPPNSSNGSALGSAPSCSALLPPTITSTATTVGGVRVSVLDKPPTQLPMVTLPYHMPNAAAPRPMRPPSGGYPMEIPSPPGMRAYLGGGHSPDGLEPRQHLHPLSQVYRPGMISPYPPAHLSLSHHPPYHHTLPVRLDPTGMPLPYMDWPVSNHTVAKLIHSVHMYLLT